MEPEKPKKINIEIYVTTRDRLYRFGNLPDTKDTVLNNLMDACEPAKEFRDTEAEKTTVESWTPDGSGHIPSVHMTNTEEAT